MTTGIFAGNLPNDPDKVRRTLEKSASDMDTRALELELDRLNKKEDRTPVEEIGRDVIQKELEKDRHRPVQG